MEANSQTFCDVLDLTLVSEALSKSPAARRVRIHGLSQDESLTGIQKEKAGVGGRSEGVETNTKDEVSANPDDVSQPTVWIPD